MKKYPSFSLFLFPKVFDYFNVIIKKKYFHSFLKKCIIILSLHEFEHKNTQNQQSAFGMFRKTAAIFVNPHFLREHGYTIER